MKTDYTCWGERELIEELEKRDNEKLTLLTKKESEVLIRHSLIDISYQEGGTFNCEYKESCDFVFDTKDATIVEKALHKIKNYLTK